MAAVNLGDDIDPSDAAVSGSSDHEQLASWSGLNRPIRPHGGHHHHHRSHRSRGSRQQQLQQQELLPERDEIMVVEELMTCGGDIGSRPAPQAAAAAASLPQHQPSQQSQQTQTQTSHP